MAKQPWEARVIVFCHCGWTMHQSTIQRMIDDGIPVEEEAKDHAVRSSDCMPIVIRQFRRGKEGT